MPESAAVSRPSAGLPSIRRTDCRTYCMDFSLAPSDILMYHFCCIIPAVSLQPQEVSPMKKILVIGSAVADIVIHLEALPKTSEDVLVQSQSMSLGGCAFNVADMLRHFRVPYTLFAPVGSGIYGDFVQKELTARGMSSPIRVPERPNGCCYCFVEPSGERTFLVDHGAEYLFRREWFGQLDPDDYGAAYVCGLEIEEKTGNIILDFLEQTGLPFFFAPGPRIRQICPERMNRIFSLHPVLHLNDEEVCSFTGCADPGSAASALCRKTGNTVIVTCGENGAGYCSDPAQGLIRIPPVPAERVEDTIGAGDGHCGAVIACLAKGMRMPKAVAAANAVSSRIVSVRGALLSEEAFRSVRW